MNYCQGLEARYVLINKAIGLLYYSEFKENLIKQKNAIYEAIHQRPSFSAYVDGRPIVSEDLIMTQIQMNERAIKTIQDTINGLNPNDPSDRRLIEDGQRRIITIQYCMASNKESLKNLQIYNQDMDNVARYFRSRNIPFIL